MGFGSKSSSQPEQPKPWTDERAGQNPDGAISSGKYEWADKGEPETREARVAHQEYEQRYSNNAPDEPGQDNNMRKPSHLAYDPKTKTLKPRALVRVGSTSSTLSNEPTGPIKRTAYSLG